MQPNPTDVPLIRLVVVPEKCHGARIRTIGFVRFEFEGDVIYPHREDYDHALVGNGIWIEVTGKLRSRHKELSMKYCLVEGIFDAKQRGHFGMWSGTIKNITRFQIWSDPARPQNR